MLENINLQYLLYGLFAVVLLVFLAIDIFIVQQKAKAPSYSSSLKQTGLWFAIAMLFAFVIYYFEGQEKAVKFVSAYLMEWSLSTDNIFVFILILNFFKIKETNYQKILFWGILGAIVFRGIFIGLGTELVDRFHFILYIFGVILIYTGIKMYLEAANTDDEDYNPNDNIVYKWLTKNFRFTNDINLNTYWVFENGKRIFTPLFLVVCLIATTDVVFAIDSIPAVLSISQDKLIVYSSNVFAVMGLRAMFFMLSTIIKKFYYLQHGISFILVFIGIKMLAEMFNFHIGATVSLFVIIGLLAGSMLYSTWVAKGENEV
jgi:tellurite resistance protein TerC